MPDDDASLLRRYAEDRSEAAFAELVRRHLNLVYYAALRQTGGNAALAEEVAQTVFGQLARHAASLHRQPVLAGWLYTSTRFAAHKARRAEQRRRQREHAAYLMNELTSDPASAADWERLRPVIDDALHMLDECDRAAVLLRFFEGCALAEIGAKLALSEEAARKRIDRALDKMQAALARRGVTSTAAALGAAMAGQASLAAPVGLAVSVTGAAAASAAAVGGAGWAMIFMSMTKLQVSLAGALAVAGAAGYIAQGRTNAALQQELVALQSPSQSVAALRAENHQLTATAAEVEELRRDDAELRQLERRVVEVKKVAEEKARLAQARAQVDRRNALTADLREKDQRAQAEVDRMNREGNALVLEYKALSARISDPALTPEQRTEIETAKKAKLAQIQAKQNELLQFNIAVCTPIKTQAAQLGIPISDIINPSKIFPLRPASELGAGSAEPSVPGQVQFTPGPAPAPRP